MQSLLAVLALLAGQDGEWAADWPDAARRARDEKKLVLVLVELYGGLKIPERLPPFFAEGDLAELKRHRFVGLRWKRGMKAPFQDPAVYGMGSLTFGAALLVATPDGRVVGQCAPHGAPFLDLTLRSVLLKHPEFTGSPLGESADPLERAELLLRRGEVDQVGPLVREPGSARGFRLQASYFARQLRGADALEALRKARERGGPEIQSDLDVEEGRVLLGLGKPREAAKALVSVLDREPADPRVAEAKYLLSHILLRDDLADGKAGFEETVRTSPGSVWGEAARTILSLGAPEAVAAARLQWPTDRMLEVVRETEPDPLAVADAGRAAEDAVAYLLRSQLPDGSWSTPASLSSEAPAFTVAATAICASSLLPYRDRKEPAAAVDRALEHVLGAVASGALDRQGRVFGFGYAVWGRAFALRFLARASGARGSESMKGLVRELARDQTPSGGWSYYAGIDPAFVTATVILALQEALEAGVPVPEAVVQKGLRSLESGRDPGGAFRYAPGGAAPRAEAGVRSPLCALALLRGGRGKPSDLVAALDRYLEGRLDVRKERGKALCHTGPDGTAAYYLLFGYAFAAESLGRVAGERRAAYRSALLEDVLAARRGDGSFLDFPAVGRHYGTGMALTALARLR